MTDTASPGLFALDRDAKTSPKRLAILIGAGLILVLITLWMFSGDDAPAPPADPATSQPVAPAPPPSATTVQPRPAAAPTASISQFTLHGVTGLGTNGAAIIDVAGQGQRLVRTGRDVVPGILLVSIAANHIILRDRGNDVRLGFPDANGASAVSPVGSASAAASPRRRPGNRDALEYETAMQAHRPDGDFEGYRLRSVPPVFAQAGLNVGDVITEVGGTELEGPDDVERIPRELRASDEVTIVFSRNGRSRTVTVSNR